MPSFWGFCCPICGQPLHAEEKSLLCPARHCFDRAKSGYVNLLPVNHAHSKAPGDNKSMVEGRTAFLNRGYYAPLLAALCQNICLHAASEKGKSPFVMLDAGCGEGYYTAGIAGALDAAGRDFSLLGVDISKPAVNAAAKRCKKADFAVASVFHLPVMDGVCDLLLSVFAPLCREEFIRVLRPGGTAILVIPGPEHLFELKAAVYDAPYENQAKPYPIEGFAFLGKQTVQGEIFLESPEDIQNLFAMTPYFYKTSKEDMARLYALSSLTTRISFEILTYQKDS